MGVYEDLLRRKKIIEDEQGNVTVNSVVNKTTRDELADSTIQTYQKDRESNNNAISQMKSIMKRTAKNTIWEQMQNIMNNKPMSSSNLVNSFKNNLISNISNKDNNKNKSLVDDAKGLLKLTGLGTSTGTKQMLNYIESANENNFNNYKNLKNRQFLTSKNASEEDKTTAKTQNNMLLQMNGVDTGKNIETNLTKKAINDSIEKDNQKIQEEQSKMSNVVTEKLGEIAPSIGQQIPGIVASSINPILGASYFTTSAGGNYIDDAKQRGMTDEQAFKYGTIMGAIEGSLEAVGSKLTTNVGKNLLKKNIKGALVNYGLDIGENFLEEAIVEPISEFVVQTTGGKEKANWSNILKRMWDSGVNGALVSAITGGASGLAGGVASNFQNNQYTNNTSDLQQQSTQAQQILPTQQTNQEQNNIAQNAISAKANSNLANNLETLYNNIGLEKTKNIPIQDILPLRNGGGIRNNQQINNLRKDIKENGIKNPIELVRNNDGSIEIENGNHRLLIAEELGLKEVPIKFVESWDNIGISSNLNEKNVVERGAEIYDRDNGNSRETTTINAPNRFDEGNSIDNRNEFENRGTTEKNDRLSRGIQGYNDRPSSNTTLQENTIEQSKIINILPIQETSKEASINLPHKTKKTLNPTEISNITLEDVNTTPTLRTKDYGKGNKQSSFFSNIVTDAKFLKNDLRQEIGKDENIRYYKGISNQETLEKAYKSLNEEGKNATLNWFNKDSKDISAEDVAKGWILLKQYQDNGDYQGAVEVAKKMRDMGTKAGQAVQAYNILSRLTPEGMFYYAQSELNEAYNKMVQGKSQKWIEENQSKFDLTPEETQFIMDNMNKVAEMEDGYDKKVKLAEIQKIITDKIPPTAGQSIKAWMRISMLFNPKTQVRNIMGNAIIMPVNMFSDSVSAGIDRMIAKKTGVRTTGNVNLKNYGKGFGKGLYESYNDFRKGINTRNIEGNRFEVSEGRNFKNKGIGKALNRVDSLLSFMLDAGDRGFYEATFTNSINNQLVLNNTTEVTQEMINIATNEALQRTWQDNNKYTEAVLKIRNILNYANIKGYGLGDVIIPFAKTPANLTKAIVDYSPVGLVKAMTLDARTFKNSLENGQFTPQMQHKFVQNLGKGMAGSFLYILGYALAKAGIASGEADEDKDVKNFMKNSLGISSYSLKIGNKTFTYDWAQPVATPLAIMTNYVKYSKDNPDANILEKGIKSLNIGTEQLLQQSFMESLNTVLNGNGTTLENLSQAVLELPARAIPTFSKQIADMVDGTQRTSFEYGKPVKSAINSVTAKIPFASKTLPVSRDTLGNEIKKYGGENNIWNVMFNPANVNKGELSKAGEEIYRLYQETGETTLFPITAPYYINSNGEQITMTSEERSNYQKVTGEYTEKAIEELLSNRAYKELSNDKKAELITDIISDSNAKAKYDILDVETEDAKRKRELIEKVGTKNYYDYRLKTKDIEGQNASLRKNEVLLNANYSSFAKEVLYVNTTGKEDKIYNILKDIDIDEYLDYKIKESKEEFSADKDSNGNSISGTSKKKYYSYINSNITDTGSRLIILGSKYKLSNSERHQLSNYINKISSNNEEAIQTFEYLSKNYVVKGGKVYYK